LTWYIENPARFRSERFAIEALARDADWLNPGSWTIDSAVRAVFEAEIVVGGQRFPISLRYPAHFPHSPPLVLPRGDQSRWSHHQYGAGGELCLEYGPDNWHPDLTGADMLASAERLLDGERPQDGSEGIVASRHATTTGQNLSGDRLRFVTTRFTAAAFADLPPGQWRKGMMLMRLVGSPRSHALYMIKTLDAANGDAERDPDVALTLDDDGFVLPLALVRLLAEPKWPPKGTRSAFLEGLALHGIVLSDDIRYAVVTRNNTLRAYWLKTEADEISSIAVVPAEAQAQRLDADHAVLAERRVGIVGCGSLGSKIAAMLARAGVGKFLLIDDDLMARGNLVRHDLDSRDVGLHKAAGVARRLQLINPAIDCDVREYRLGGQQSSGSLEGLLLSLAQCDVLIDASADPKVFNYMASAVAIGSKPLVWAEVFGGGFGGLIARHRPGREPIPAAMRGMIETWCAAQGKPIPRTAPGYEQQRDDTPLIADDADVTAIAAPGARLAIDTLIGREPSWFPLSVYLIGLRAEWIFEAPFETRPIDVGSPLPAAPEEDFGEDAKAEECAQLRSMLENFVRAAAASDTAS
jgi:molybdopterin/thiamine biosynthesis adenylyltransferase